MELRMCLFDFLENRSYFINFSYIPKDSNLTSETFHYKRGANQQFCQMTHVFDPSKFSEDDLLYDVDKEIIPIAIHCVADEGPEGNIK